MHCTHLPLLTWAHAIYLIVPSSTRIPAYKHIGRRQPYLAVNRSAREYARTDSMTGQRVHVNRVECFNGFMRRAVTGVAPGSPEASNGMAASARYRKAVAALRGWIRTEVGRVLNVLVTAKWPAELILERLNFQNAALSRRLNRIIPKCGRAAVRVRLAYFQGRFGMISGEVIPARTSHTCSCCGYVNTKNRPSQSTFQCLRCGNAMHAESMRHGTLDSARRCLSVPCSSRMRQSYGTGAPVPQAKGALHAIRWQGFHRRPAIAQSLLRWGNNQDDPSVENTTATRFGGR